MTTDQMYSMDLGYYPTKQIKQEPVKVLTNEQQAYKDYVKQCKINRMSVQDINREFEMARFNQFKIK